MVTYYELGANKQLNEIVVAGSHDAGITSGKSNVRTQALDIMGQAKVGVRVFDLRVTAATEGEIDGTKGAKLRAFHADPLFMKNEKKTRHLADVGKPVELTRTKLKAGAFGAGLTEMLRDARNFVNSKEGSTEFLILKFDKCLNWELIAEECLNVAGSVLLKGNVNVNTTKLKDLAGKVIVLFSSGGISALANKRGAADGILGFKNLYDAKAGGYVPGFAGLQYFGKGGTSANDLLDKHKVNQNETKQRKLMKSGKTLAHQDVMGMMYWTSTGILRSIESRNKSMWAPPNITRLKKLWGEGLGDYVDTANPFTPPVGSPAIGAQRKRFMPNIVMIDFADETKCQQIRDLNDLTPEALAAMGVE
jgi:hypothetical protein